MKGPILIDISPVSCNIKQRSYIGDGASKDELMGAILKEEGYEKKTP